MDELRPLITTMDRKALRTDEGQAFVRELNSLAQAIERRGLGLPVTSWLRAVPAPRFQVSRAGMRALIRRLRYGPRGISHNDLVNRGGEHCKALSGIGI